MLTLNWNGVVNIAGICTQATRKNYELVKNIILEGIAQGIFKSVNVDIVTLNIIAFVPRIFSASPFITDLLAWQGSGLLDKEKVYRVKAVFLQYSK